MYYESKNASSVSGKVLFDIVSALYGKTKETVLPKFSTLSELVNRFSNFFYEKIKMIRNSLDCSNTTCPIFDTLNEDVMINFEAVTPTFVKNIILSSSPKSCSLDPLPTHLLFNFIDSIIDSIKAIINESLHSGTVPSCFKHAIVNPLIKKNRSRC